MNRQIDAEAAYAEAVSRETLAESIRLLRWERPALSPYSVSITHGNPRARERALRADPRVARVLAAVAAATAEERAAIADACATEVRNYLDARQVFRETGEIDERLDSRNAHTAYPLILAAADETGESLSVLLEWYDTDEREARMSLVGARESHLLETLPAWDNMTIHGSSTAIPSIAGAMATILDRLAPEPPHDRTPLEPSPWLGPPLTITADRSQCVAIAERTRRYLGL